ncbi:MAG: 16S rRNA (guanine(966)-N(2))-methyltransferase RsmD [Planctomycetales bacterium]
MMQIIAGKYRHRKLESSPGEKTRPITARVKVALFDRLQPELEGARVADIFSGTGTIGLEALSRGARSVLFIDNDRVAFDLLKENVARLKAEEETMCWRADASKCSFRPHGKPEFLPFDVVFFDPPYLYATRLKAGTMLYRSLERLSRDGISAPGALLVFRCARDTQIEIPATWRRERVLVYSSMEVHLFRKAGGAEGTLALDAEPIVITDDQPDDEPGDEPITRESINP